MKKALHFLGLFCAFLLMSIPLKANNVQISNVTLANQDVDSQVVSIKFDISWENSWRVSQGPANWDAAWVFIKYRVGTNPWQHAILDTAGHVAAAGSSVVVPQDGMGAFIYRSTEGSGNVSFTDMRLQWNYGDLAHGGMIDIKVFAIEMVNIPQAAFKLGSGGSESNAFYTYPSVANPYEVSSENAITISRSTGYLHASNFGYSTRSLPAAFPKGYQAFYVMKYEVSQGQYVDFLNTITPEQAAYRVNDPLPSTYRYSIIYQNDEYIASTPHRACNFLSWFDGLSYADWAGLRPLTELEFEKICRGTAEPVANEYVWGSINLYNREYTLINDGTSSEDIVNPGEFVGNAWYSVTAGATQGPVRVGILPSSATYKRREDVGGAYYGVFDMAGNLLENVVAFYNGTNSFDGRHGDGELSGTGQFNETYWPTYSQGARRGGAWSYNANYLRTSDRALYNGAANTRTQYDGFRCARTQP